MEDKEPMTHARAGLLISAAVIIASIIPMLGGGTAQAGSGLITYAILLGGLVVVINLYGRAKKGNVTFSELFSYGFKTTAVYTVIFVGFLILFSIVVPDFKTTALAATRKQMEAGADVRQQQVTESLNALDKYFWVFAIGGTTLFFVIIGAVGSLLGAAITKKNPQTPIDQTVA
jgi:hypothetical protein